MVADGVAPHYTDVARAFGVTPDEGLRLVQDLMNAGLPCWLAPHSTLIASFPPFNNQPTHYRLSVDGQRKWFAQCGLEALAACWVFPGKTVHVQAPCLRSGETLAIVVRDGHIQTASPGTIRAYVSLPVREWRGNLPFA